MQLVDGYLDRGLCIGTPADEGCSLRPSLYVLGINEDAGDVALLGLCPFHEGDFAEVQSFLALGGYLWTTQADHRNVQDLMRLVHDLLGDYVGEVGSSWTDVAAS